MPAGMAASTARGAALCESIDIEVQRRSCKHRSKIVVQNSPGRPQACDISNAAFIAVSTKSSTMDYPFDVSAQRGASLFDKPSLPVPQASSSQPAVKVITIRDYEFDTSCTTVFTHDIVEFELSSDVPLHAEHVIEGVSTNKLLAFESCLLSNDQAIGKRSYRFIPQYAGEVRLSCQVFPDTMDCHLLVIERTSSSQQSLVAEPSSVPPESATRAVAPPDTADDLKVDAADAPPILSGSLLTRNSVQRPRTAPKDMRSKAGAASTKSEIESEATIVILTADYKMVPADVKITAGSRVLFKCEERNVSSHHLVCVDADGNDEFDGEGASIRGSSVYTHLFQRNGNYLVSHEIFPFMKCKVAVAPENVRTAPFKSGKERLSSAEARRLFVDMHIAKDEAMRQSVSAAYVAPPADPSTALAIEREAPVKASSDEVEASPSPAGGSAATDGAARKPGSAKAEKKKVMKRAKKVAKRAAAEQVMLEELLELLLVGEEALLFKEVADEVCQEEKAAFDERESALRAAAEALERAALATTPEVSPKKKKKGKKQKTARIAAPIPEQATLAQEPPPVAAITQESADKNIAPPSLEQGASTASSAKKGKPKKRPTTITSESITAGESITASECITVASDPITVSDPIAKDGNPEVDEMLMKSIKSAEQFLSSRWQCLLSQVEQQTERDASGDIQSNRNRIFVYRCPDSSEEGADPKKKKKFVYKKYYKKKRGELGSE